jgi:hypothetical protein
MGYDLIDLGRTRGVMGRSGIGRWMRYGKKTTVEDCRCLGIKRLSRAVDIPVKMRERKP